MTVQHRFTRVLIHGEVNLTRRHRRGAVEDVVPVARLIVPRWVVRVRAELETVDVDVKRVLIVAAQRPLLNAEPSTHSHVHYIIRMLDLRADLIR